MAHFTNGAFSYAFGDWLTWSGFSVTLRPNTTYAYTFGRDSSGTGWAALNYSPTNAPGPYTNGVICIIPQDGGLIGAGGGYSAAVFDLGLLPIGVGPSPVPYANPLSASPARLVTAGTQVTLNENATGQAPLHYHWQTDGGSGTITNIPGNDSSNLVVNTTGWNPGIYQFDVTASNSFGSSKSAVLDLNILYANTTATLTDVGAGTPSVEANDLAQPVIGNSQSAGGSPDGLNYYFDNASPPGQVFTTGSNPGGYVLNSLALKMGGGSGGLPAAGTGQEYLLRLYSVSGSTAIAYAVYSSETNFGFTDLDWLRWTGFSVPLAASTSYAFTFGRISSGVGWDSLSCVSNSPPVYNGGACLVPPNGGQIKFSRSGDEDATFILGLTLPGYPLVSPPVFSPSSAVYAGTLVGVTANVTGPGPFTYQWQTDGGGGGALTNITGATNLTLTVDTTEMGGMTANYDLVATNGSGATTSEVSPLIISSAQAPFFVTDITNSLNQNSSQLTAFVTGSVTLSDTSFQGTLPIYYQWQFSVNGTTFTSLAGQTNDTLTLGNLAVTNSGYYLLVAYNSVGTNTTGTAVLTVMAQPAAGPFTVNFQWHSTVAASGYDVLQYFGHGVPGCGTGTWWNQVIGPSTSAGGTFTSSGGLSDDGSTNRGFTWTVVAPECWDWDSTPVIALLDSAVTIRPTESPASFTFTLPNGFYNVVLFSCNGTESFTTNGGAVMTLNGVSQTVLPTQDTNFVQGVNYVVFPNVVVTGAALSGTCTAAAGKSYGSLNGAQLQYLGPAVTMSAQRLANGQVQLQWSAGTLLQAPAVTGPWTTNSASSPYTVTPTPAAPQMFYKIIAP
jgi:hypothetical protein